MRRFAGRLAWIALTLGTAPGLAEGWVPMDGPAITDALSDRAVTYENAATQRFFASGRTLYTHGEPAWGYWRVVQAQYCSQWPPAPDWACYDVFADGAGGVQFRDRFGTLFTGTFSGE